MTVAFFKKMYEKLLGEDEESEATSPAPLGVPAEDKGQLGAEQAHHTGAAYAPPARSIELKIAKLTVFNEQVMEVADHLIAGRPVVLNLEGASKEAMKRIIDFFSGVAYTIQGQLKVIAGSIYIVTPSSVDVAHESLLASAIASGGTRRDTSSLFDTN